ncbi:MAG: biotin/lipoyl-containing protein [Ardenticatenia bacterium]|nr:biotin/lipoyl-containing protein [Ardenticatenia bacterium]
MSTRYIAYVDGQQVELLIHPHGALDVDGHPVEVHLEHIANETIYSLIIEHHSYEVYAEYLQEGRWVILVDGERHEVVVEDERMQRLKQLGGGAAKPVGDVQIKAPMPGLIVKVPVQEGQQVTAHEAVIILEAMKMENEIRTPVDGVVKSILVKPGQAVDQNEILVVLGPP